MHDKDAHKQIHYSAFSLIYDRVMRDVDYPNWCEHVIRLAKQFDFKGKRWLDLACGTASTSLELIPRGYEMTGVDFSPDMLAIGGQKAEEKGYRLPLLQGRMEAFEQEGLPQDFDVILCLYDSLNYLTEPEEVQQCFREVHKHLKPGGGFIFDVTTEYNLLHNFSGYTFAENFDDNSYIWENKYDIRRKFCQSTVTIFYQEDGAYRKAIEDHNQRVYTNDALIAWLEEAGFESLGQFEDVSLEPPEVKCERIHLVARKRD